MAVKIDIRTEGLPKENGRFMTNIGYLDFYTYPYAWHPENTWVQPWTLTPKKPNWWLKK